ncbi:sugar ABC transporter permease [Nonomuraea sp. KC401]|uniref:carbohydrate ABC transporter permease n=1 Tax=unclassified Nonomuraea TaxID=2593643 RepID=UPI0010FD8766|nr:MULTISPECIES: sugar ABC transporter permease [unclassified Nonomuraea]NBE99010.1 ABC transporter permease subunit [Nonomuraea sp. K271]TLF58647.1 sugar ABC transporter permease [Nonomuraea sp. KC401]
MAAGRIPGQRWYTPYLFVIPALVLFGVFFAWPAVTAIQLSFLEYDVVSQPVYIGMENFTRIVGDGRFWTALLNSLLFLVGMFPLLVVVPLLLAVLVNQRLPGIRTFRMLYYLPVVTSMVAVGVAWEYVFHQQGVLNWILTAAGLLDQPIQYLLHPFWALPALVLVEGWKSMGFYMMIYLAGLQTIPTNLYEAAKVDGATAWHRLRHITVPLMVPYIAVAVTVEMLDAMQAFTSIYVMTRGGPQDATLTLGYYIWSAAFEHYEMGYASAMGLVLWVLMIAMAILNYRLTRGRTVVP